MSRTRSARTLHSQVSHDLSTWSTESLVMRGETLDALSQPQSRSDVTVYIRLLDSVLCTCGGESPCEVDSPVTIDAELGSRAY